MNSCEQFRPMLSELLDDELSTDDAPRVQTHLDECPQCYAEWKSLQELDGQLARLLVLEDLDEKVDAIWRSPVGPAQVGDRRDITQVVGCHRSDRGFYRFDLLFSNPASIHAEDATCGCKIDWRYRTY